jgi:hypothetical protein
METITQSYAIVGRQQYTAQTVTQTVMQGAACPVAFAEEPKRAGIAKQIAMFFFRFGVCPMCMTASISFSLYELVRFRRIRTEYSLWEAAGSAEIR